MKCTHCSTRVERTDWFCPNCRRSIERPPSQRLGWAPIAACGAAASVLVVVGVLATSQVWSQRTEGNASQPRPLVVVRDAPLVEVKPSSSDEPAVEGRAQPAEHRQEAPRDEAGPLKPPVAPALPAPAPGAAAPPVLVPAAAPGDGMLSVLTVGGVRTFVYLNGGALLGETPLRTSVPAGKHTLVFWSPSIGGRSTREVEVEAGESVVVTERIRTQESFQEAAGT